MSVCTALQDMRGVPGGGKHLPGKSLLEKYILGKVLDTLFLTYRQFIRKKFLVKFLMLQMMFTRNEIE